ncbi:hypothetical protein V8E36_003216 [Tilletia maclaganii]
MTSAVRDSGTAGSGSSGGDNGQHRPLNLALPGSSLDFGSTWTGEAATPTPPPPPPPSTTGAYMQHSRLPTASGSAPRSRVPTFASSPSFLHPASHSSQDTSAAGSPSSPHIMSSAAFTASDASSSAIHRIRQDSTHSRESSGRLNAAVPTGAVAAATKALPPTNPSGRPQDTSLNVSSSPLVSASTDASSHRVASEQPLPSPKPSHPALNVLTGSEHLASSCQSTDSFQQLPSASPAPLPISLISDTLRDTSRTNADSQSLLSLPHPDRQTSTPARRVQSTATLPFSLIKPEVQLQVFPLVDSITMFGSTQTSSNYSISGKCVLSILPNSGLDLGHLGRAASSKQRFSSPAALIAANRTAMIRLSSPLVTSSSADEDTRADSAAHESQPIETASNQGLDATAISSESERSREPEAPTLKVTSLKASFRGYALYMDHTARFAALKLAEVEEECLPDGAVLPFPLPFSPQAQTSRYEIEFDLSIPGWMPASLRSRFGGNFYCVAAVAKLSDGREIRSAEPEGEPLPAELAQEVTSSQSRDGLAGLWQGNSPAYADAIQYREGLPQTGDAHDIALGRGTSSPLSLRERIDLPLPPPPVPPHAAGLAIPTSSTRQEQPRPASYAPGSQAGIDYERALPAIMGEREEGRRGMPTSASWGVLDLAQARTPRHSTSLPPPAIPLSSGPGAGGSSGGSSALSRLKGLRQGRHSGAAAEEASTEIGASTHAGSDAARGNQSLRHDDSLPSGTHTISGDGLVKKKNLKARTSWLSKRAKQFTSSRKSTSGPESGSESPVIGSSASSSTLAGPTTSGLPSARSRQLSRLSGAEGDISTGMASSSSQATLREAMGDRTAHSIEADPHGDETSRAARHEASSGRHSGSTPPRSRSGPSQNGNPLVVEQADGSLVVKSEPKVIIIRRCRDVVPVSIARVAQPGVDGLNIPVGAATAQSSSAPASGPSSLRPNVPARLASNEVLSTTQGRAARAAIIDESEGATHGIFARPDAEPDLHPLERRERDRAEQLEDEGMHDGEEAGEETGVFAPAPTASATPSQTVGQSGADETAERSPVNAPSQLPAMLPVAPSALNAPTDPHKLAAMASAARNAASTGSRSGGRRGGPSGSGSGGGRGGSGSGTAANGAPMRHFLHRPVLHAPAESNIEGDGLPFALTLSLPSHVQVEGASSDMLTFGLQIEVGRSRGWGRVRELGGLRLRDMELVCLQTERHSSAASRTFCNAFTLPSEPHLSAEDIPVLPDPSAAARKPYPPSENRLRQGYDRELLVNYIRMVQTGNVPNQRENNVERSRTTIVGPPPLPARSSSPGGQEVDPKDRKGKKVNRGNSQSKSKKDSRKSVMLPNLPDPLELANGGRSGPAEGSSSASANASRAESSGVPPSPSGSKPLSRGRRAYANALNRLSHFASAMLDGGTESDQGSSNDNPNHGQSGGGAASGGPEQSASRSRHRRDKDGSNPEQPRATYSFNGEDGNGVDLTKGRVRMTINLPLVPSIAEKAREMGAVQLIPDYESPYVRIRHKLKVKLGFGFGTSPLGGEGWWGQALVMCVPVRFTDSPPTENRPTAPASASGTQSATPHSATPSAALSTTTTAGNENGTAQATASISPIVVTDTSSMPTLPAYTQLFREDGSRLGDEGEDLPQYPGAPEGSAGGANGDRPNHVRRPSLLNHHRGSITGPQPSTEDPHSNRIVPSRVVDEAAPNNGIDAQSQAAAARELAEMSDVGEAGEEEDEDDEEEEEEEDAGPESETDRDDTENDVEEEEEGDGTLNAGETRAAAGGLAQGLPDTSVPAGAAIINDDSDSQHGSVKGKSIALSDDLQAHNPDDGRHTGRGSTSSLVHSTTEQFHGKESRWALASSQGALQGPHMERSSTVTREG